MYMLQKLHLTMIGSDCNILDGLNVGDVADNGGKYAEGWVGLSVKMPMSFTQLCTMND